MALAPGWRVRLAADGAEIKPPHALPPPDNVAVRRIGARTTLPPSVKQWVWLSILLHILAVVLFGDTTGGGSRRGDRLGGPLKVTLQAPANRDSAEERLALRADTRLGSLARRESALSPAPVSRPAPELAPAKNFSPPLPKAIEDALPTPVLPPVIAKEVEKPVTPFVVPLVTPEPVLPPEPPAARRPESLPRLNAIAPPQAIEAPSMERDVALPAELIPRLAPLAPARTERDTVAPLEAAPRLKTFVPPGVVPDVVAAPPLEIPRMAPLAPPPIEQEIIRPAELLPRLPPVAPAAAIETATPTERVPRAVQPVPAAAEVAGRSSEPARTPPPAAHSTVAPGRELPSASRVAPGTPGGTANVGDALTPRAPMAAPPVGSAPRIDLDAVRQRAREIAREGSGPRTLLPLNVRPKEEIKTREQQAFDKALKRPDCRDAYSAMGLAAVVPLLWDAVSEKGCKW
jgi:hypothetical protein